ncbi:hypothetical protein SAMN02745866_00840 [Alteromonadaceae bacterium Bs31]|nr:hypothetical protein SAMN02745866_00840 [Alteromonadaceae bacterium Bs31]
MEEQGKVVHLSGYQARDLEVVDYKMYQLGETGLSFRGPEAPTLEKGQYFTCIGAAQTFGCFCDSPYPALLSQKLGIPNLNLGYGGAGPEFFLKQKQLHTYLNNSRFVILQAMSGRSQSNSMFDCDGLELLTRRSDGKKIGANEAYQDLAAGSEWLKNLPPKTISAAIARRLGAQRFKDVVNETRRNWVDSLVSLCNEIEVPVIFFWFSKRGPDYADNFKSVRTIFSEFPQMVNGPMVRQAAATADHYVECVSERGSPQPLFSRHTGEPCTVDTSNDRPDLGKGKPWTHNTYYPSPEMQQDAAEALLPACEKILSL